MIGIIKWSLPITLDSGNNFKPFMEYAFKILWQRCNVNRSFQAFISSDKSAVAK